MNVAAVIRTDLSSVFLKVEDLGCPRRSSRSYDRNHCIFTLTHSDPLNLHLLARHQEGQPSPGQPFKGGLFEAYLPDCGATSKLLPRLETAFRRGLTFTVTDRGNGAVVTWDRIPHKTSVNGGKSG